MNPIINVLEKQFERYKRRGWDRLYIAVDIHETLMLPDRSGLSRKFYNEESIEALRLLSEHPNIVLILWTCSKKEDVKKYLDLFLSLGIVFNYHNENPEVGDECKWGDYSRKFYKNVLLEDKSGFLPEWWPVIYKWLQENLHTLNE